MGRSIDRLVVRDPSSSLVKQAVLAGVTVAFPFAATMAILKVIDVTVGLRVTPEHEEAGLDASQHGEFGYRL
jgi:ammonium transporter, Amt family